MGFRGDDLDAFQGKTEELLERYLRQLLGGGSAAAAPGDETDFPPLDIYETAEGIIIEAELPGVDMESLEVTMTGGTLVIEGVKEEIFNQGRVNFLCMERTFGAFRRMVPLLEPIDSSRISASYRKGILQVTIPKVSEKRGLRKKIVVSCE
jgi:HSP20 family protein